MSSRLLYYKVHDGSPLNFFQVEESYKLETAFRGTFGSESKPNICVISEFDALPEIGHACGHNLIAEVGVASAVGIMAAMKASNKPLGKVISEF